MKSILAILVLVALLFSGCNYSNLDEVKANACKQWKSVGYECIGYEGFQFGSGIGPYGGAKVWHSLRRTDAPGIIYTGYIKKWGNEYHVYGPTAVDAIKPSR